MKTTTNCSPLLSIYYSLMVSARHFHSYSFLLFLRQAIRRAPRAPAAVYEIRRAEDQGRAGQQHRASRTRQQSDDHAGRGNQRARRPGQLFPVPDPSGRHAQDHTGIRFRIFLGKHCTSVYL